MTNELARRSRFSVFIAISVDGYIARADGSIDWLSVVQMEGEDYGYKAFTDTIDIFVVGRKTYDTVLAFDTWPFAGKRCIVLTHRPPASRHGEEFFAGTSGELAERLAREGACRVYVDGGAVIQQFLAAGLLDDITLSVVPVILGGGIRLFGGGEAPRKLILEESRSWPTGLTQLRYRVGP